MIYSASQFNNENDVLEIKLETIGHLFDVIVLAEATVDQRGRPKSLNFDHDRFSKWGDKIRYFIVEDMPTGTAHADDVRRERWQRDALLRGMPDLRPDDLAYISDLDEIPHPDALEDGFRNAPLRFGLDMHVYSLNWRWLDRGCRIGSLGAVLTGESILRQGICQSVLWDSSVPSRPGVSGWHLTYQGGHEAIKSKITGMMDKAEALVMPGVNADEILSDAWISRSIFEGHDVFGRTYRPTEWVDWDQLPPTVGENLDKYRHMMVPRPPDQDDIESKPRCTCGAVFQMDGQLGHYRYCAMAGLPFVLTVDGDNRIRPRSLDI